MTTGMKPARRRILRSDGHRTQAERTILGMAGALLSIIGAVLAIGGYVSPFSGSAFYMFMGAAMIMSGLLIGRRHRFGVWTYMALFAATVTWSLRGMDSGSSLAFRLLGPIILLAILAVLMPVLSNWRPRRAVRAFVSLALLTIGVTAVNYGRPALWAASRTQLAQR